MRTDVSKRTTVTTTYQAAPLLPPASGCDVPSFENEALCNKTTNCAAFSILRRLSPNMGVKCITRSRNAGGRQRRFWHICVAGILALACTLPALADRDIVYSARYYLPPGSNGLSHFHLYRIDPSGLGRIQITFGSHDDENPFWSPDGRLIAFQRDNSFAVLDTAAGRVRTLMTLPGQYWSNDAIHWSPDGRKIAFVASNADGSSCTFVLDLATGTQENWHGVEAWDWSPDGTRAVARFANGDQIVDLATGKRTPIAATRQGVIWDHFDTTAWLTNDLLVADSEGQDSVHPALCLIAPDGSVERSVIGNLTFSTTTELNPGPGNLLPLPGSKTEVLYVRNASISTWESYGYFILNLQTGRASPELAEGQFIAFSPDLRQFCTAPHRDLSTYQKLKGDYDRDVWTAPLQIGNRNGGQLHTITHSLVYVSGADWRRR